MLNLRKKTLALAIAATAALGGGISAAQAQVVSANGYGEVLIYPYFTVRDGWRTFIHVTNTSGWTIATKVRFHAAKGSEDLLDFVLVLSPYDMWTAVVEERNGGPGLRPTDNSCTVPNIGIGNFQPFLTSRLPSGSVNDAREGYAEIIEMGVALDNASDLALAAKHDSSGQPADCGFVQDAFGQTNINTTRGLFFAPENVLTGKFDMINTARAYAGASRAVAIADFTAQNIVYGQYPAEWDYPNLANTDANPPAPAVPDPVAGIVNVNAALNAVSISNEWVLNPGINELSSWVITFPTKYLTIDVPETDPPTVPPTFTGSTNCPTDYQQFGVPVTIGLYNREEKSISDVGFSPGTGSSLCYETNVINFVSNGITSAGLLNSVVSKNVNTSALNTTFLGGWASVAYADLPNTAPPTPLPGVGFNLTARSNADGDSAVLYDHVYDGRFPQAPVPPYVAPTAP